METIKLHNNNGIYSCDIDISIDEWISILGNSSLCSLQEKSMLYRIYYEHGHRTTCKGLEKKYELPHERVNFAVVNFAKAVQKYLGRFVVLDEKDKEKFWCIPMESGTYVNGLFEWTMRQELVEAISKTHLTWIPFYKEIAKALLKYRDNRQPLIDILLSLPKESISYFTKSDEIIIKDIDPFSFFAVFNRSISDSKRVEICNVLKGLLLLESEIPADFDGIPVVNNMNSYFFNTSTGDGCEVLWSLFEAVMNDREDIALKFEDAIKQRGVKWNSTMFLFWIKPEKYLPLDVNTRLYVESKGVKVFKEKELNWNNYINLIRRAEERFDHIGMAPISYNAWVESNESPYKKLIDEYRKQIEKDKERTIYNEQYKWSLLESCNGKSLIEKAALITKENVINQRMDTQIINGLITNVPSDFERVISELCDEDVDLDKRLSEFKVNMSQLCSIAFPGKKLTSNANDERVASAFLTCSNFANYTFYKNLYYQNLIGRLNIKGEPAGKKYSHYMKLIKPLADLVADAEDIKKHFNTGIDSDLLIAQNILYIMTDEISIKSDIIQTLEESERFRYINNAPSKEKYKKYIWIGDRKDLIGNKICHYEFIFNGTNKDGHLPGRLYVEVHFEDKEYTTLFKEVVDTICKANPEVARFKWSKGCCDAIRINNKGFDLYSASLVEDIMYELEQLDDIVGERLRQVLMMQKNNNAIMEKNKPIIDLLKSKKQIILQGAPGTGKTYKTAEIAVEMCDGSLPIGRDELMKRYRELCDEGRVGFTTFHQSMDYEEFVEGVKPVIDEKTGAISYKIEPGIFLKMCQKASEPIVEKGPLQIGSSSRVWKVSLGGSYDNPIRKDCMKNGYIRIGWDVYGDFLDNDIEYNKGGRTALDAFMNKMQIGDIVFSCYSSKEIDAIGVVTGDYEFNDNFSEFKRVRKVEWLVKDIQENIVEINGGDTMPLSTVYRLNSITVEKVMHLLSKHDIAKISDNNKPYILIIDEINRGNISKILGELITLLEIDKRKGEINELPTSLTYSKQRFCVPSNLYIIGTMNTADRSVGYIDYAVRRRFSFYTIKADRDVIWEYYNEKDPLLRDKAISLFDEVKKLIYDNISSELNPEDLMVGHSYFLSAESEFNTRLNYEIKPLLYEYANDSILQGLTREKGVYKEIDDIGKNME